MTTRPHSTARGYGRAHRKLRADWQRRMDEGETVNCWRCGEPIEPGEAWDLGHDDDDRTLYRGPEHAGRCNRSAAGRRGHIASCRNPAHDHTTPHVEASQDW
jgi:hypothetical protein